MSLSHFVRTERRNNPETASLPIRVFHAVPEPSFSAAKNSLPGIYLKVNRHVRKTIHRMMLLGRMAGSEATVGRKPKARVSFQECPAVSGSFPHYVFRIKWSRTKIMGLLFSLDIKRGK
jgi:hypothetical protein